VIKPAYTRRFIDNVLGYSLIAGSIGAIALVMVYIVSHLLTTDQQQARAAFALANMHFAIHVYWDVHDISVFSPLSIRKHPREFWIGVGLLVIGLVVPTIVPGLFDTGVALPAQWALIIVLPLMAAYIMRIFIYGTFMRGMMKALRA
jgi:hypothetical protein